MTRGDRALVEAEGDSGTSCEPTLRRIEVELGREYLSGPTTWFPPSTTLRAVEIIQNAPG